MSRLPSIGGDDDQWGSILNDYLSVSLNSDGTIKSTAVTNAGAYNKLSTGIPPGDLSSGIQQALNGATTTVAGVVQLTNDLGGIAAAPKVIATHLTSALPAVQGGTGNTSGKGLVDVASGGVAGGTRSKLNFIGSGNVTITATDDAANSKVDITIADSSSGGTSTGNSYAAKAVTLTSGASTHNATSYDFLLVNAGSSGGTIFLPTVGNGATVRIKKTDTSTNGILVQGLNSTTIDGQASFTLNQTGYPCQDFMSDGTNWYLV